MQLCNLRDKTLMEEAAVLEQWVQEQCDAMRVALGVETDNLEADDGVVEMTQSHRRWGAKR